ncbi:MAG TPA: polyprenyl synthetase family protein [Caldisericia bacterium]|nr:polyprenyl synthetase family protein [Caldisericia bacterium]
MKEDLKNYLDEKIKIINNSLNDYLSSIKENSILYAAISYSLFPGGKRLRPVILLTSYESIKGDEIDELAIIPACAVELIHTYSLIHDDLPIMDNSDTRRGKPATHKVYGDDIALLAGDALLTHAFYLLSSIDAQKFIKPEILIKIIQRLSEASGVTGLVEGQAFEAFQRKDNIDEKTILYIHEHKTAALFGASLAISGILTNSDEEIINSLSMAGKNFGMAYQIADDMKDCDTCENEANYAKIFGKEKSLESIDNYINESITILKSLPFNTDRLIEIFNIINE